MAAIVLRAYQEDCIAALRHSYRTGHRAPLLQLPTGGGKTVCFSEIAFRAVEKGNSVLVLAHRRELIRQASAKLTAAGVPHGIILAGYPETDAPVQVASIQTIIRRLARIQQFALIVIDEAHHAVSPQYRKLFSAQHKAKLLGVTATPARLDGKGLGLVADGPFDDLVIGPTVAELIEAKYLSDFRVFVPAHGVDLSRVRVRGGDYVPADLEGVMGSAIVGDAVKQYEKHAPHQPTIAFCISVQHAQKVAARFREAGFRSQAVFGAMKTDARDAAIGGLATGDVEVLTTCDLISEGLDVPSVGCVICLRPTKSLGLHLQQVGRGLRPAEGKSHLIVLDHASNCRVHGLPDTVHEWSLAGMKRRTGREKVPGWQCECGVLNRLSAETCKECGAPRPEKLREVAEVDGDLEELDRRREAKIKRAARMSYSQMMATKLTLEELAAFARHRGYRRGWVQHRFQEQNQPIPA